MWFFYSLNTEKLSAARYKVYCIEIELEFGVMVLIDGGKPENLEKNSWGPIRGGGGRGGPSIP